MMRSLQLSALLIYGLTSVVWGGLVVGEDGPDFQVIVYTPPPNLYDKRELEAEFDRCSEIAFDKHGLSPTATYKYLQGMKWVMEENPELATSQGGSENGREELLLDVQSMLESSRRNASRCLYVLDEIERLDKKYGANGTNNVADYLKRCKRFQTKFCNERAAQKEAKEGATVVMNELDIGEDEPAFPVFVYTPPPSLYDVDGLDFEFFQHRMIAFGERGLSPAETHKNLQGMQWVMEVKSKLATSQDSELGRKELLLDVQSMLESSRRNEFRCLYVFDEIERLGEKYGANGTNNVAGYLEQCEKIQAEFCGELYKPGTQAPEESAQKETKKGASTAGDGESENELAQRYTIPRLDGTDVESTMKRLNELVASIDEMVASEGKLPEEIAVVRKEIKTLIRVCQPVDKSSCHYVLDLIERLATAPDSQAYHSPYLYECMNRQCSFCSDVMRLKTKLEEQKRAEQKREEKEREEKKREEQKRREKEERLAQTKTRPQPQPQTPSQPEAQAATGATNTGPRPSSSAACQERDDDHKVMCFNWGKLFNLKRKNKSKRANQ
jgi:hypothetical protein